MQQHSSFSHIPAIAVTLGDPAGVGPEVVLKALANRTALLPAELTVIGTRSQLLKTYDHLRQQNPDLPLAEPDQLTLLDVPLEPELEAQIQLGVGNAASGEASFRYLDTAIAQALTGKFAGIVTAPIAKSAWQAAGHHYPGQTELLAQKSSIDQFGMLFVARSPYTNWVFRTLLATTHISLRQVPDALTPELMTRKLKLLIECLKADFGIETPNLAIAALNPHAGEDGQLGAEEKDWLRAWVESARAQFDNPQIRGPVPPDTLWVNAGEAWYRDAEAVKQDAYLALYHDQGLIPLKLLAFDQAVNTTIGLPFVRTSPDHGTAFDIAGSGKARAESMKSALCLAVEFCTQRRKATIESHSSR